MANEKPHGVPVEYWCRDDIEIEWCYTCQNTGRINYGDDVIRDMRDCHDCAGSGWQFTQDCPECGDNNLNVGYPKDCDNCDYEQEKSPRDIAWDKKKESEASE